MKSQHLNEKGRKLTEDKENLIAVFDLETDPFAKGRDLIEPFVAGFYDGKDLEIFWGDPKKKWEDCIPRFIKQLMKCPPGTLVYAHNGGNFDFHFLLEYLPVDDCKFMCMGKRIVQIKIPVGYLTIKGKEVPEYVELRDSFAIIPKKLAAFNKDEIDYAKFERPVREKHRKEITEYLKTDLRSNREMVIGFLKRFPAKLTLASSVFDLMKKEFDYNPGRSSEQYDSQFRPFFFGGRVQFWKLGEIKGEHRIIDINSAYPWGMTQDHWFGFECVAGNKIPKKHFEQSFFEVECFSKGAFPFREKSGAVSFPEEFNKYFVSGWELKAAMDLKLVSELKILISYTPKEIKSMKNFSQTLYDRKNKAKMEGDTEEEFFAKIAVNSGFGRLALNVSRFSEVKVTTIYDEPPRWDDKEDKAKNPEKPKWDNCWNDKDRGLSFWKRSSYREGIDKFINVATAASITGCVRAFLLRSMAKCKGVVYCDTDSIIAKDISKMHLSDKLGDWKLEMTTKELYIAGKKLYAATDRSIDKKTGKQKWKKACKGVNLPPDKIIEVALGKEVEMTFDAPTFSLFSKPKFVSRKINRADQRKKK